MTLRKSVKATVPFCLRLTPQAAKSLRDLAESLELSQAQAVAKAVAELKFCVDAARKKGDCNAR
jgi:ABC-type tungstate transport system substrate-binding protein